MQRAADQIRRELASLIHQEVRDPRIRMVSVTDVEVSGDLAHAKVYVTVMEAPDGPADGADDGTADGAEKRPRQVVNESVEEGIQESLQVLNKASGYLRTLLAKRLQMRTVPRLQFRHDRSVSRGRHLSDLIDRALAADRRADAGKRTKEPRDEQTPPQRQNS